MYKLTPYEIDFLELYARAFDKTGKTKNMGRIFGLFLLKSRDESHAMDQQEIENYLTYSRTKNGKTLEVSVSLSTVSRTLTDMAKVGYIANYFEEGENNRPIRKYFMKSSLKDMAFDRLKGGIYESQALIKNLNLLLDDLPEDETNMRDKIVAISKLYGDIIRIYDEILKRSEEFM
ncbi:MAG: hypothetical protein INQ03_22005 [Candidatus Heimdallarchaeota archaeon]|nr:hypothetical protein [Candidatus Heimdallarchaeota archaeon]